MTEPMSEPITSASADAAAPPFRYTARLAGEIEHRWQDYWEREHTFEVPNPAGPMADPARLAGRSKLFVMDMFPYPSGVGLHVGHPLGYIATDVFGRYMRMSGYNVLHTMGYDAFGLPAEQYAVQTGQHPRTTTDNNIATMRAQLRRIGLAHDQRRSVTTMDPSYYRWTQWIFLQLFNSWYDVDAGTARPITELVDHLSAGRRPMPGGQPWAELGEHERQVVVDGYRLAYLADAPVNWCPGLGTVLANEEVTADGRSERGNFPVFRRNLPQWMLRITAYADRLLADLDRLEWPEPLKNMQRNWIGRSEGARVTFRVEGRPGDDAAEKAVEIEVFTTRPDTLFGATYMVLAPEHPLVDAIVAPCWPVEPLPERWTSGAASPAEAVATYRHAAARKNDVERQAEARDKTGVFVGAYAVNPANGARLPIFVADYVLMGYGTGAIMAVPAQDERDWEFAEEFGLPIVRTVEPPQGWRGKAWTGDGPAINSGFLDGMRMAEAKAAMIEWLAGNGHGEGTVTYKLRDWLFSRQRYWGEPFPIVYEDVEGHRHPIALPEEMLPVELPEIDDYSPRTFDPDDLSSEPEPPLSRARDWVEVELDLGEGRKKYHRESNTMPQWAGSCWYELRYLDPENDERLVDPEVEHYWMGPQQPGDVGGVDLYVGGVEHAVLHLLYSRFWHKVLFDLGHVSSEEPFRRLFNQGYIQAYAYTDSRGFYVPAEEVEEKDGGYWWRGELVNREYGKMGKSLKNAVTPDDMCAEYGADTLRVYEMSMGPLDTSRAWETRAVVGSFRFLQRLWRALIDEATGDVRVSDDSASDELRRALHRTIAAVRADMAEMRFNTAIAKLIELTNVVTKAGVTPREVAEPLTLMVAPIAPHLAEELWSRMGHHGSLAHESFPQPDAAYLVEETVTCVVQVAGKVRDRIEVPADVDEASLREQALASAGARRALDGRGVRTVVVRAPRLVNIVPD